MRLLVLTTEYPNPNSKYDTPVVHYYVKKWIELGHEVRVIHARSVFPAPFYPLARMLKSVVVRTFKTDFIPFHRLKGALAYRFEGVDVLSLPIFKLFPHVPFLARTIRRHARSIHEDNAKHGFEPDVILCHFLNPQLPLITELRKFYPAARTSLVIHEDPRIIPGLFGRRAGALLDAVDHVGFRNQEMKERFVRALGDRRNLFLCPSGVPDRYIREETPDDKFRDEVVSLCFVGMLIPLKNVDVLVEVLHQAYPRRNFRLRIVGEGLLKSDLEALVDRLGLSGCVSFEGSRSRDEVQAILAKSDLFVMVSKPEAFGLAYLEAMAQGCITIGTRGQGIDGVIVHGENGFLCEARDVAGLRDTLLAIGAMTYEEKRAISARALRTAASLSDGRVAAAYLERVGVS